MHTYICISYIPEHKQPWLSLTKLRPLVLRPFSNEVME